MLNEDYSDFKKKPEQLYLLHNHNMSKTFSIFQSIMYKNVKRIKSYIHILIKYWYLIITTWNLCAIYTYKHNK